MSKLCIIMVVVLAAFGAWSQNPRALPARKAHVDKNKDGVVTSGEIKQEQKWEMKQKSKVNTPWEAKADANKDGHVDPQEAAQRYTYIRELSVVDRPWEKKADANADGRVDLKELKSYHLVQMDVNSDGVITGVERHDYWIQKRSVVNTPLEKKYDTNGDGNLTWEEGRELLKDRLQVIRTDGRAIVNTDIEMEFDANSDGVIDATEAVAVQKALAE